jgi:DNA-binding SARP family transcriptional activator/predicted ATPase
VDGKTIEVDTRKATALLIYLALAQRAQSRDRLAGLLWPEYDQDRARAALRRTLSALRKALGERWVSADRLAITLDPEGLTVDLLDFRKRVAGTLEHEHEPGAACASCAELLQGAVDLYGGPFLQGFSLRDAEPFDEWQSLEVENVDRELSAALDGLVRAQVAVGDLDSALRSAQRKLAIDPLDEPAHRQLMQLFAWKGMRTSALQQYRECVALLDRELGVSPLAETTTLYESISEGGLTAVASTELQQPPATPRLSAGGPGELPLRGRVHEWEALVKGYEGGRAGSIFVIEGEAGIGKTRLARDLAAFALKRGAVVLTARAHQGEAALPYSLIADLLTQVLGTHDIEELPRAVRAEAARLVPAFLPDHDRSASIDDPGALARFFDGVLTVLSRTAATGSRVLVFLDDLHWCDTASLDLLSYMARRLEETPLSLLLSWRSEQVDDDHRLREVTAEAARARRAHRVHLQRLKPDDVSALVKDATALDEGRSDTIAARLMRETEGIPLFVVEYLAILSPDAEDRWQMPSTIKELLRSRVNLVGQTARQILGAAAVIDRSFDFDTVWRASGRTELETVEALDELVQHALVVPLSDTSYEFSHEKLRAFIYESMGPARRRVLHRRVAEAFIAVERRGGHSSSFAGLIARHLELGGLDREAAAYHEVAAAQARTVYANREALEHYLSALALGHPDPAWVHEGAADMQILLGNYRGAVDSLEKAASLAAPEDIAVLEHKLGEVHLRRGDYDLSQSHLVVALETIQAGDDRVDEARLLAAMSSNAHRKGDLAEAVALAERALKTAATSGDGRALARALNQRGLLENAAGHHAAAAEHLNRSLQLAVSLDDGPGRVAALNNLALAARKQNDLDEALALTRQALKVCSEYGDRHREAALRNNLADLLHEQGDEEAAMRELKQATAALAEIGEEPTGLLPEVWKLVDW